MNVLITGGTSSLCNALKPVLSLFSEVITAGRNNCDIYLDVTAPTDEIVLPYDVDVVIHTAAHFGGKSGTDIIEAENINVIGTLKICEAAARARAKHFIFISTAFSVLPATSPSYNIYSISKRHAEEAVTLFCNSAVLPLTILRPSQVYGSEEHFRKHQPFFYAIIDKAEQGKDVILYGTNDPKRNYIHINDLTNIIANVVKNKIEGIYGCANTLFVTYSEIAGAAYKAFGTIGKVLFLSQKKDVPDNLFEIDDRLYKKLGIYPVISIEEGVQMIANFRHSQR
jgi:nucleoside-diphosphate-sugar epimerase